jgi:hypothetical protein
LVGWFLVVAVVGRSRKKHNNNNLQQPNKHQQQQQNNNNTTPHKKPKAKIGRNGQKKEEKADNLQKSKTQKTEKRNKNEASTVVFFFSLAHKSSVFFFLKKEKGVSKRLSYFIVGFKSVQANGNGLLFAREQEKNHSVSSLFFSVFPVLFLSVCNVCFLFFFSLGLFLLLGGSCLLSAAVVVGVAVARFCFGFFLLRVGNYYLPVSPKKKLPLLLLPTPSTRLLLLHSSNIPNNFQLQNFFLYSLPLPNYGKP